MLNKSKGKTMQTNNKKISNEMFEMAKSIQNVSRSGNLYGQLMAINEMQLHLLQEEKKIKEQIEKEQIEREAKQ